MIIYIILLYICLYDIMIYNMIRLMMIVWDDDSMVWYVLMYYVCSLSSLNISIIKPIPAFNLNYDCDFCIVWFVWSSYCYWYQYQWYQR